MATLPTVTITGNLLDVIPVDHILISSVNHALGNSPGACVLNLPDYRPFQIPKTVSGRNLQVAIDGLRIFAGYIFQVKGQEDQNAPVCDLYAFDDRALLNRQFLGNQESYDANRVGFDVIFNKGGKPDRYPNDNEWYRDQRDAVFWTVGNIIDYIAEHYISQFSDLSMATGLFSNAASIDNFPGEVSMMGMGIASGLDMMIALLGRENWAVDYTNQSIYRVSMDDFAGEQYVYYMENDPTTAHLPDGPTMSSYNVNVDGTRAFDQVTAISDYLQVETTLDTTGELVLDTGYNAAPYYRRYRPSPNASSPEDILPADWLTSSWSPALVTRVNEDWDQYITAAEMDVNPQIGSPVPDRECLWLRLKGEVSWYRMKDGFEVEYEPPGFYVERFVNYYTGNMIEPDPPEPGEEPADPTPELASIDLAIQDADFAVTVNVLGYQQIQGVADAAQPLPFYKKLCRALVSTQQAPLYRYQSAMPILTQEADVRYQPGWVNMPDGWYVDVGTKMENQAEGSLKASEKKQTEIAMQFEIPFFSNLGRQVFVESNTGTSLFEDDMILTGLDWMFGVGQMSLQMRAENQMGGQLSGEQMTSDEMLNFWRHQNISKSAPLVGYNTVSFNPRQSAPQVQQPMSQERSQHINWLQQRMENPPDA